MTTFSRFAVVAALLTATTLAPGLAAADDHKDRDDRDDRGRYDERDGRNDRHAPPVAAPRWVERDELRWSGPGRYDGRWERSGLELRTRAIRLELFELDRERADFHAGNVRRPWLLARYDASWYPRRAELERRLEWLRATARR
jgi:hypothetical protein